MLTSNARQTLRQARLQLLEHGECSHSAVAAPVARSWQRSLQAGLMPAGRAREAQHSSQTELARTLSANHALLSHSRPVMEYLYAQVRHSQAMVILADRYGTLMHTLGHPDFLTRAERVALSGGASWNETHRGTNAIGTALAESAAIEIQGAEHFFSRNDFLTCSAVPLLSARGEVMGVLDISGDYQHRSPYTLGLVDMASRMIENRLLSATCKSVVRVHLHAQQEGIGTVGEGIIALSGDGWIVGANRSALELLDMHHADIGTLCLADRLNTSLDALLARHHRKPGQVMAVEGHSGKHWYLVLHPDPITVPPLARTRGRTAGVPAQRTTPSAALDALQALDSGDSRWRAVADKVRKVIDKPIALLIQGESGVGKELLARAAHASGARALQPFVAINCAAVPENLIEAELFGYAPGAFSGARREGSPGRIREADGGTLFLDEIGDMPLPLQARLLRVLQERQVSPLGAGPTVPVDFALVCASHRKLPQEVAEGRFRSDLYYRINGLTVALPALREREDFAALTQKLLQHSGAAPELVIAADVMQALQTYAWPGNLRQYANVLQTACALLDASESCIDWQHLPDDITEALKAPGRSETRSATLRTNESITVTHNLQELSRQTIRQAIDSSCGNLSQAAKRLGISRQTLYRRLND